MRRILLIAVIGFSILSCLLVWNFIRPKPLDPLSAFSHFVMENLLADKQVFMVEVQHADRSFSGSVVFTGAYLRGPSSLRGKLTFHSSLHDDGSSVFGSGTATLDTTSSGTLIVVLRSLDGSIEDVLRRSIVGGALEKQILVPREFFFLQQNSTTSEDDGQYLFASMQIGTGVLLERRQSDPRMLQRVPLSLRSDSSIHLDLQHRGIDLTGELHIDVGAQKVHEILWNVVGKSSKTSIRLHPLPLTSDPGPNDVPTTLGPSLRSLFHIIFGNALVSFES